MAERKLTVYYELSDGLDEEAFFDHVHRFFCDNPNDPDVEDCPLYAMTVQDVLE